MHPHSEASMTVLSRMPATDSRSVSITPSSPAKPAACAAAPRDAAPHGMLERGRVGLNMLERAAKRLFDLVGVLVMLALFAPIMLGIALAVRMTTGRQVIYGHTRIGRDGREFQCYKFRSMVPNADEVLRRLLESDPQARAEWERDFKLKDDPRITRVGRFIRKTSLDELPQLWNVLRGEMSIVGPRPIVQLELDRYYDAARDHYLSVRPGLTGLWQVSGRNDIGYDERVNLDRHYVDNWNVWTDMTIVLRTVGVMFGRKGAY